MEATISTSERGWRGSEWVGRTRLIAINEREGPEASRVTSATSTALLLPHSVA
jgi:hypothetical protein